MDDHIMRVGLVVDVVPSGPRSRRNAKGAFRRVAENAQSVKVP
jgi:hypothetical protein